MKLSNLLTLVLSMLFITLLSSCEKNEEYKASITVINSTAFNIDSLTLKGSDINWSQTIEKLSPTTQQTFEVKWTGKTSALFGSTENSYTGIITGYSINGIKYDIKNLMGAQQDANGNFYTEENITNGSKVTITINQDNYEVSIK